MTFRIIIFSLLAVCLFSCASHWGFQPLESDPLAKLPPECEIDGACYVVDDMYFEQSLNGSTPVVTVVTHQEIAIVNERGLSFATIPLQGLRRFAQSLELKVTDAKGNVVYEAPSEMLSQYRQTGNIAVPGVRPGQRISLTVTGMGVDLLDDMQYVVQRPIPVVRSRFTLASIKPTFEYRTKEQGFPKAVESEADEDNETRFSVYRREFQNVKPPLDLPYLGWFGARVPRIRVALEECTGCYGYSNSWKHRLPWQVGDDVSPDNYKSWLEDHENVPAWQNSIYELVDSLIPKKVGADSARHLLYNFMQQSFRLDTTSQPLMMMLHSQVFGGFPTEIGQVIQNRRGGSFLLARLYVSMLKALGIDASLMMAGSLEDGGLDFSFPSTQSDAYWMVRVKEKAGMRALVPYMRGYRYGNYPIEVDPQSAILLASEKTEADSISVPPRLQDSIIYDVYLRLDSTGNMAKVTIAPSGLAEDRQRFWYAQANSRERTNLMRKWFTDLPNEFTASLIDVPNEMDLSKPFRFDAEIATPGLVVEHQGQKIWRFGMLFDTFMDRLDSSRTESVYTTIPMVVREHVYVPKTGSAKVNWLCEAVTTPLMDDSCSQSEENGMLVFHRTVNSKIGKMKGAQMQEELKKLWILNRVRESSVTF